MLAIGVEPPAGRDPTPRYHGDVFRNPAMPMSLAADAVQPFPDTPTIRRRDAVVPGSWPEGTLPLLARLYASRGAVHRSWRSRNWAICTRPSC
jgi:single-stranded-DNA-specific exonuclease